MLCSVTEDSSFAAAMAVSAAFSLSFSLSCAKSGAQKSIAHASAQEIAKRKTRSPETTTVSSTPRLRLIHILLRASNPKGRQAAQFYAALGCKSKLPALRRFRFSRSWRPSPRKPSAAFAFLGLFLCERQHEAFAAGVH